VAPILLIFFIDQSVYISLNLRACFTYGLNNSEIRYKNLRISLTQLTCTPLAEKRARSFQSLPQSLLALNVRMVLTMHSKCEGRRTFCLLNTRWALCKAILVGAGSANCIIVRLHPLFWLCVLGLAWCNILSLWIILILLRCVDSNVCESDNMHALSDDVW